MAPATSPDPATPLRRTLADAVGLVLPVECAGCGRWDVPLCPPCAALLRSRAYRCEDGAPMLAGTDLPVWAVGPYRGALRAMVLAWKNHRRTDLAPHVLAGAEAVARAWVTRRDVSTALAGEGGHGPDPGDVVLVPAPSGWRRRLARRLVVADLADALARGTAAGLGDAAVGAGGAPGPGPRRVLVADLLRRHGGRAHQAGMGRAGRSANRRGTVRVLADPPPGSVVLLVDDVLTTGSTLASCAEALRGRGATVVGALVLASTPAPGHVRGAGGARL